MSNAYQHITALLISHTPFVFYPKYEDFLVWPESNNDFMLIHNYNATHQLPNKALSLYREFSYDKEGKKIINILENC